MDDVHDSDAWTTALDENGWTDAYLTGSEFETFLAEQQTSIRDTLVDLGLVEA